jgi:hypothetical protein
MSLGEYIEFLEKQDQEQVLPIGFLYPHSYRGNYSELAFVLEKNVPISTMLKVAKECVGKTFEGYKGGDFKMDLHTEVIYQYSQYGVYEGGTIDYLLLRLLIAQSSHTVSPDFFVMDYV